MRQNRRNAEDNVEFSSIYKTDMCAIMLFVIITMGWSGAIAAFEISMGGVGKDAMGYRH